MVVGLVMLLAVAAMVLTLRPGGLRTQLPLVARRFRIMLALGGVYVFGSLAIRVAFTAGPIADWGPAVLAVILLVMFTLLARDPVS